MPYNTRRKSLSLPSLGIQLPNSSRSSSNRSPPLATAASREQQPPAKKAKRSHASISTSPTPSKPTRRPSLKFRDDAPKSAGRVAETTPPPSPGDAGGFKIDTQGIDDQIVIGTIEQLEKTGNRPHLLKELATILSNTLPIIESSANQSAIISSRLTNYLRRSWTALAPCPLGKELVGTHPKRVYYYLTNQPRQPIPETPDTMTNHNRIISPSLSSAADEEEEDLDSRTRTQMSPSPEIELHSPDLEDQSAGDIAFPDPTSFSRAGSHPSTSSDISHSRRAMSPALEKEEREFTQAASSLKRWSSHTESKKPAEELISSTEAEITEDAIPEIIDESEESAALRNREAAAALFGQTDSHLSVKHVTFASSPMVRPQMDVDVSTAGKLLHIDIGAAPESHSIDTEMADPDWSWDDLKSPENVELDELEDLFQSY